MSKNTAEPGLAQAFVEVRRARIRDGISRELQPVGAGAETLAAEKAVYLLREAEELYWNELAWEELTDEERVAGGHLTELVFPGFLAFIEGLLLEVTPPGVYVAPRPHPEVVEEVLLFLGDRYAEATAQVERGADSEALVRARAMTAQLIDLVLFRLYRLSPREREELESRG
jgi:hypothetical protein